MIILLASEVKKYRNEYDKLMYFINTNNFKKEVEDENQKN